MAAMVVFMNVSLTRPLLLRLLSVERSLITPGYTTHPACQHKNTGVPRSRENAPFPRTVMGPQGKAYCRVLGEGVFL